MTVNHDIDIEQELFDILQDEIWNEFELEHGKSRVQLQKEWDDEMIAKILKVAKEIK